MKKISQILRETDIPQVRFTLIKFENSYRNVIGKCALGVLACESSDINLHLSFINQTVNMKKILDSYGIDSYSIYPFLNHPTIPGWNWDDDEGMYLSAIITTLNDVYEFTFKEIADFLETTFDL